MPSKTAKKSTHKPAAKAVHKPAPKAAAKPAPVRQSHTRQGFRTNEHIVYPSHGVGQIARIEEQEVAGFKLELFVISFAKDKMILRVPTSKALAVGMRKLAGPRS